MSTTTENGWTNPYEDQICSECSYGAIDSDGLCVIDAAHTASGIPQTDGYYWYLDSTREEIIEVFEGRFYTEHSRYALAGKDVRRSSGRFAGPLRPEDSEQLAALREALTNALESLDAQRRHRCTHCAKDREWDSQQNCHVFRAEGDKFDGQLLSCADLPLRLIADGLREALNP